MEEQVRPKDKVRSSTLRVVAIRIEAPGFTAGILLDGEDPSRKTVVEAAPIVQYMMGWREIDVLHYCQKKGWKTRLV